jgi:DNA repair protein RecO (recombination protein O)
VSTRRAAPLLQAFVLHRYDWSESSLILDVLTRERGRLAVAAKGARRPYSQLRPVLLPFQRVAMTLARSPAEGVEVHTLRQAEWAGGLPPLGAVAGADAGAGEALFRAYYCNELVMKLLAREDPHPVVFDAYAATLPALAGPDALHAQAALRAFELVLLREVGVLPDLSTVTLTVQPVQPAQHYLLVPESGVMATREESGTLTGATLLALQRALDAQDLAQLQAACLPALAALRGAMRTLLQAHAGGATWRTRDVMQGLRRLLDSRP